MVASEQDEAARARWREDLGAINAETVVFLEETSTQTAMTRMHGRAPRGERVGGAVPRNHGPNATCLAAVSVRGVQAPCVCEGALDGARCIQGVRAWLGPTLAPGLTVVLDNLSVHRNPAGRQAIEAAAGHLRYLPAYSPDFNPIALVFAKLKTYRRGVAARAVDPLVEAIGAGVAHISTTDIAGDSTPCGYQVAPREEQPS